MIVTEFMKLCKVIFLISLNRLRNTCWRGNKVTEMAHSCHINTNLCSNIRLMSAIQLILH